VIRCLAMYVLFLRPCASAGMFIESLPSNGYTRHNIYTPIIAKRPPFCASHQFLPNGAEKNNKHKNFPLQEVTQQSYSSLYFENFG
jgi:hypothetical protein